MKLNDKQKRFVREYLVDLNATKAAQRAGYSKKTAYSQGHDLLKHPEIQKALRVRQEKRLDKLEVTSDRVLAEIAKLGFANIDDFVEPDGDGGLHLALGKTTRDQRAAISEITEDTTGGSGDGERKAVVRTKVKLYDKTKSLEMLGRHLKMFTDKVEHSGEVGVQVVDRLLAARQRVSGSQDERERGA